MIRVGIVESDSIILEGRQLAIDAQVDLQCVYTATNAQQVLDDFSNLYIDVLVVDQRLQGVTGVEVISKLAELTFSEGLPTKFVLTAAFAGESLTLAGVAAGASAVVSQQQSLEELLSACRVLSKGQQFFSFEVLESLAKLQSGEATERAKLQVAIEALTPSPRQFLMQLMSGKTVAEAALALEQPEFRARKNVESILLATGCQTLPQLILKLRASEVQIEH